jgi:uncharacterized membrane protein (GlpM family)
MPGALIAIVVAISLLALMRFYPFAGMVSLLPVFALATHYFASGTRIRAEQKNTLLFSLYSKVPLLVYL